MKNVIETNVVQFESGHYFNGVKGMRVRKTKHFPDAKRIDELSSRDKNYLADEPEKWALVKVRMTIEKI